MRPEGDHEADIAFPTKKDSQVIVDAEGPVVGEVAFELVRAKERIPRVGLKTPQRSPQQG